MYLQTDELDQNVKESILKSSIQPNELPSEASGMTGILGIGEYEGEQRYGPDGRAYQWVGGVDDLGNSIGFWDFSKYFEQAKNAVKPAVKTGQRIIQCSSRANRINVIKAVKRNAYHAKNKGWGRELSQIQHLIDTKATPKEKDFAYAVARWQCAIGMKLVDGIIGGNTYRRMRSMIKVSHTPTNLKKINSEEAVIRAVKTGNHDVGLLTNIGFFARHPELGGRKLRNNEKKLIQEWKKVRDDIVIPTLLLLGISIPAKHIRGKRKRMGATHYQTWISGLIRDWHMSSKIETLGWVDQVARDYLADRDEYLRFNPKQPKDGQELADLGLSVLGLIANMGGPLLSTPVELFKLGVNAFRTHSKKDPPVKRGSASFLGRDVLQSFIKNLKKSLNQTFTENVVKKKRIAHTEIFRIALKPKDEATYRRLINVTFPDLPLSVREAQVPVLGKAIGLKSTFSNAVQELTEDALWKFVERLPSLSRRAVGSLLVGNRGVSEALEIGVTPPRDIASLMQLVRIAWVAKRVIRYRNGRPQLKKSEVKIFQRQVDFAHSDDKKQRLSGALFIIRHSSRVGGFGLHLSVPVLVELLSDEEIIVRQVAAEGLAQLRATIAIPEVIEARLRLPVGHRAHRSFARSLRKLGEATGG